MAHAHARTAVIAALAMAAMAMAMAGPPPAAAKQWGPPPQLLSARVPSLAPEQVQANQTFLYIVARDGVPLWTVVSVPTRSLLATAEDTVPTVLERTPYTTDTWESQALVWNARGFAYALQDQRGSGQSREDGSGAPVSFSYWRADGNDTEDTSAWIAAQPWSSGEVLLRGGSANGIPIYVAAQVAPTPVRAIYPIVASADLHSTTFQGGAYRLSLISWWLAGQGFADVEEEIFAHEGRDAWWDPVDLFGHEDRCTFPGVHSGGFWDIFADGTLNAFDLLQNSAPDPRCRCVVVMGRRGDRPDGERLAGRVVPLPGEV